MSGKDSRALLYCVYCQLNPTASLFLVLPAVENVNNRVYFFYTCAYLHVRVRERVSECLCIYVFVCVRECVSMCMHACVSVHV